MKTIFQLLIVACFFYISSTIHAQDDPTNYHLIGYMKVEPGMHGDYLKLEKAWKKIHAARKEAGDLQNWSLSRVISPTGADVEYNYVTRNTYRGDKQLANHFEGDYMPENWTSLLTPEEIQLVMRTGEIRTIVRNEVWTNAEVALADDYNKATITVFNYFDHPEGKSRADHFAVERDIWLPLHKARIADGSLKGWVLLQMMMPGGSSQPYHDATVDIYADMNALLADPMFDYFEKIHPGKKVADLMERTNANSDLMMREVRMTLDRLDWE